MTNRENARKNRRKRREKRKKIVLFACVLMSFLIIKGCGLNTSNQQNPGEQDAGKEVNLVSKEKEAKKEKQAKVEEEKRAIAKNSNHINAASKYAYDTKEIRDMMTGKIESDGKKVAFLTFDDGPNNKITPQILDTLDKENVPATFFIVGSRVTENVKDVVNRIIKDGHGIALHSFSHDYHKLYPGRSGNTENILEEMNKANEALQNILGKDFSTHVLRFPGGHMSWKNMEGPTEALASNGMEWIDWNCLVGDGERKSVRPTSAAGQLKYVKSTLEQNENKDKAVVLLHDAGNKQLTANALPQIIQYLRDSGYSFGILK
ncbi:polysaccharide deacetylase family protein [Gallicola sp. Sow4_E12]|uniref:polysaccharide deacetylase family protein n=1 Tax=Gallicola sp. Sow4_E12 TaxID=3438785 RepID=UPI003F8DE789